MGIRTVKKQLITKWRQCFPTRPEIINKSHHQISLAHISQNANKVMQELRKNNYSAYLVGGSVRDLLVGEEPKDFDVATNANPEQVRKLFPHSRIIGRRFRIVHVYFRAEIIEVSTFRANSGGSDKSIASTRLEPQMLTIDNTYGTIEEDAWRRDFTVNALYYNSENETVIDYVNGMRDILQRCIRMIGEPTQRFHEDPVRLLRAIRLAAKLNFKIDEAIEASLRELGSLLYHVPPARILDELTKLFFKGYAFITFQKLYEFGYFTILFPKTDDAVSKFSEINYLSLFHHALKMTDYRFYHNMSLNPAFLLSIFLWPALQLQLEEQGKKYALFSVQVRVASQAVLLSQNKIILLSRRITKMIRSIWLLQYYLLKPQPHQIYRVLEHRYFRAAIDFLQLRVEAGEPYQELFLWWQKLRALDDEGRKKMVEEHIL